MQVGNIKEALQIARRFMDIVISDEGLFGAIECAPDIVVGHGHWALDFLMSMMCLYSCEYEKAIKHADSVIRQHICPEVLFLKARALGMLGLYDDADSVYETLASGFDATTPDAKLLYAVAVHNEFCLDVSGIGEMIEVVNCRPHYLNGYVAMRRIMKKHDLKLNGTSQISAAFDSNISDEAFMEELRQTRKELPKELGLLHRKLTSIKVSD